MTSTKSKNGKISNRVKITNPLGLHTRPATEIVRLLQNTKSDVSFTHKGSTINAKSILSILLLQVTRNSSMVITVDGEDADDTMQMLLNAFNGHLGEQQT
jgi:phosphocarrier protein HPr